MKKLIALLLLLILCVILLTGCAGKSPEIISPDSNKTGTDNLNENVLFDTDTDISSPDINIESPQVTEPDNGIIIRRDSEGLVEVTIGDGKAELTFDIEQWDKLYDIYNIYDATFYADSRFLQNGPYEIISFSDMKIKDACIGKIKSLNAKIYGIDDVTVLLLMEDGTLEFFTTYPYPWEDEYIFYSFGKLPWLKDIVSLSYESDNEGIGEMTIFAADKNGLRYDVRNFCHLISVFQCEWVYEIGPAFEDDIECIFLGLKEDGELSLRKGLLYNGDCYAFYTGKYTVSLSSAGGKPVLALELWDEWELDMSNPDFNLPPDLIGEYFFTVDYNYFTLYLAEGDVLHYSEDGAQILTYPFWEHWSDIYAFYGDDGWYDGYTEERVLYIIGNLCDETVNYFEQGMTALYIQDYELIDGEMCWKVALGTNHDENFVTEVIYAVEVESMQVYRYDVLDDTWVPLVMG